MQLLVSDANIFIDMKAAELIDEFFALPFDLATPDVLFFNELEDEHPDLIERGLKLGTLNGNDLNEVTNLIAQYRGPSRIDCFALVLAKKQSCPLLSGDKDLRAAARAEGVIVSGSIWIIEQLIEHGALTPDDAYAALDKMRARGRRLPWDEARNKIKVLETHQA